MILGLSYATYALIAALNLAVGGTLFGWIYEDQRADRLERSNRFLQRMIAQPDFQGPIDARP